MIYRLYQQSNKGKRGDGSTDHNSKGASINYLLIEEKREKDESRHKEVRKKREENR